MCLLQETKRTVFDYFMIHNLWGHKEVDWVAKESCGLSGGLLSVWNRDLFSMRFSFTRDGFLGVCVEWKDVLIYIFNVNSPCNIAGKRKLWTDLIDFKMNNEPGEWCLGGDFNSITTIGEPRGRKGIKDQLERAEFVNFIDAFEVVDIPLAGKKFTWFNSVGIVICRLNRFLLSEGFIEKGCITNFFAFVKETWGNLVIHGKKAYVIKEKMKRLKENLKVWNREVFGIMDFNIDKMVQELNEVEDLIANGYQAPNSSNSNVLVKRFLGADSS
ncbi:uncharacterized protein LOC123915007 [Trifolium pratense]|uniref:uncharacterized protein LOC123915007 n=1 Tax=Trifolium pratense TaxID=57577 RepID=UPI001E69538F|nr:uncharacterized protein LOC123915007 [Trifolium pratense]